MPVITTITGISTFTAFVNPTGEISNFLAQDYEEIEKFMRAEKQQKKHKP